MLKGAPVHEQKELRMQRKAPIGAFCEWVRLNCYIDRKQLGESKPLAKLELSARPFFEISETESRAWRKEIVDRLPEVCYYT